MFTGIGGFEYGIQTALPNAKCVGYSEIDKYAIQTYERHFPEHKNYGDATKINPSELPEFDMLCGGFPCQAFSIAGKRRGFEDTRGTMFFEVARILKVKRPKIVLLENVKGLLNHNKGETFRVIIQTLSELGYDVQWMVLNSKFFGVPQNRERVFIIGSIRGTSRPEILPFRKTNEIFARSTSRKEKISSTRPSLQSESGESKSSSRNSRLYTPSYENCRIRRLTMIECERLQGFPDNWTEGVSDTQRYKQCGNAVTTKVIKSIMEQLIGGKFTQGATPSFNKDLTATQQVVSPKSAKQTSLNPNIHRLRPNFEIGSLVGRNLEW